MASLVVGADVAQERVFVLAIDDGASADDVSVLQPQDLGDVNCSVIALWEGHAGHPIRWAAIAIIEIDSDVVNLGRVEKDPIQIQCRRFARIAVVPSDGAAMAASCGDIIMSPC